VRVVSIETDSTYLLRRNECVRNNRSKIQGQIKSKDLHGDKQIYSTEHVLLARLNFEARIGGKRLGASAAALHLQKTQPFFPSTSRSGMSVPSLSWLKHIVFRIETAHNSVFRTATLEAPEPPALLRSSTAIPSDTLMFATGA
jgi:hypothetical protein